jgi:hypothetical protein
MIPSLRARGIASIDRRGGDGEEMIGDVAGVGHQPAVGKIGGALFAGAGMTGSQPPEGLQHDPFRLKLCLSQRGGTPTALA